MSDMFKPLTSKNKLCQKFTCKGGGIAPARWTYHPMGEHGLSIALCDKCKQEAQQQEREKGDKGGRDE